MSIRNKTISGLKWSFTDNIIDHVSHFVIGLVLARLLGPSDYGIIGMAMVFIAVSQTIMYSGLPSALIRKQKCTEADYNTMFYSNIGMGILTFCIMYISASAIATFYSKPELEVIVRVLALNLIINSFGVVESAILTRNIDFKRQTKISVISTVSSGIVGIVLAYCGFGYWSLALRTILQNTMRVILLRFSSPWRPKLMFSKDSFKDLFGFGIKILADGLLNTIFKNIYKLVIGKYFSANDLGYYTRAENFNALPTQSLELVTTRVTFPVLASIAGDVARLKRGYQKMVKMNFYISSTLLFFLLFNSREIVLLLLGEKWSPTVPYLEVMCFASIVHPLNSLNVNSFKAVNRADVLLKLSVVKRLTHIPVLIIGVYFGITALLVGMACHSFFSYFLNSMFSAKLLNYSTREQLKDIAPTFVHTLIMAGLAFAVGTIAPSNLFLSLFLKTSVGLFYLIGAGYLFKIPEFMELQELGIEQFNHHVSPLFKRS